MPAKNKKMLILYYSEGGNTQRMAMAIAEGARSREMDVTVEKVEEFKVSLLPEYDAIVIGSPTYFSNIAWPVKKLIDESIIHYNREKLKGKVTGLFTSCGKKEDGETCLKMFETALGHHHKMKVVEGIVRSADQGDEEIEKKCREYGKRLVAQAEIE
jgi:NAD(P)H dehydrogenase (quinone)